MFLKKNLTCLGDIKIEQSTVQNDERLRLIPFVNINATCPGDVFPLDQLIPSRMTDALSSEIEKMGAVNVTMIDEWPDKDFYQKCIIDRLVVLGSSIANSSRSRMISILVFLNHMFTLLNLQGRDLQRRSPLPNSPTVVSKYLLNQFTTSVNRTATGRLKIRYVLL